MQGSFQSRPEGGEHSDKPPAKVDSNLRLVSVPVVLYYLVEELRKLPAQVSVLAGPVRVVVLLREAGRWAHSR